MKLSFIIIAYNEEQNIGSTLDSIFAQVDLPKRYEVIVVNDGSRDATLEVVQRYGENHPQLRIIDLQPNQGRGAARAAGVAAARGSFYAFIDADIVLPTDWLNRCMSYMDEYDACAGTAVPDGDVTWLYNIFELSPKVVPHATAVTGSNGLYKRSVFSKVMFRPHKKDGEDIDLGHQIAAAGLKATRVKGLLVEHNETKDYVTSMHWLYQSGIGATKQWYEHRQLRLPDISFLGFIGLLLLSIIAAIFSTTVMGYGLVVTLVYVTLISAMHLHGKFYLRRNTLAAIAAIVANDSFLVAYFIGRLTGLFHLKASRSTRRTVPKKVTVNFDFESIWGMPWKHEAYDLAATTERILQVLDKHQVSATFFVAGKIVETHPEIITELAKHGHHIGLHGYKHEQLADYQGRKLINFGKKLAACEQRIHELTGTRPVAFRAPYLMGPQFYSPALYELLAQHGYQYVSNRELRHQQELFHPRRLRLTHWLNKDTLVTQIINGLLNLRLLTSENITEAKGLHKLVANYRWLAQGATPFMRGPLLEVPVYSPLDCDLIGLPKPSESTPEQFVAYATNTFVGGLQKKGAYYSLNFHDWIIGSQNRIEILDSVLEQLCAQPGVSFVNDFELPLTYTQAELKVVPA